MLDNIPRQKQVLQDIYNILSQIAVDVQPPENVAINTTDNIHTIQNFGYNLNPKHYGSYEYAISLKIGVDYNIKNLTATILTAHIGNIFPELIKKVDENANENLHEAKKTECKYKIQSSENFNTQPYCSILNKFCEEVSFVCDKNCQVFEDFKQLARANEENKELKAQLEQQKKENEEFKEKLSQVKDITEPLNSELPEDKVIREIFLIVNDCINKKVNPYKQALDEIEEFCKQNHYCLESEYRWFSDEIQDIISKAKET